MSARNLAIAPIAEEFVFRSCMLPILLLQVTLNCESSYPLLLELHCPSNLLKLAIDSEGCFSLSGRYQNTVLPLLHSTRLSSDTSALDNESAQASGLHICSYAKEAAAYRLSNH